MVVNSSNNKVVVVIIIIVVAAAGERKVAEMWVDSNGVSNCDRTSFAIGSVTVRPFLSASSIRMQARVLNSIALIA